MRLYLATLPLSLPKIAGEMFDILPGGMRDTPGHLCPCTFGVERTRPCRRRLFQGGLSSEFHAPFVIPLLTSTSSNRHGEGAAISA